MSIEKFCKTCGKVLIKLSSHSKKYFKSRKYCSLKCRPQHFRKSNKPWNKDKHTGIKPWLGKCRSDKTKRKISFANKGQTPWNKERKIKVVCQVCKKEFYTIPSRIKNGKGKYCSKECFYIHQKGCIPWNKRKPHPKISGSKNHFWKGGKRINTQGYIIVYKPVHPFCDKNKCVREHRLIMEKHLGRYLKPKEVVHHINGIRSDNRPDNLKLFANENKHRKYHKKIRCHCIHTKKLSANH